MGVKHFFIFILLLFVSSCIPTNHSRITNEATSSSFFVSTFSHNDLNRMIKYDEVLQNSPLPVFIINYKKLNANFFDKGKRPVDRFILGLYSNDIYVEGWPLEFIFINNALTPSQIMTTYFHELGHYYCYKNKCRCKNDKVLKEKHALLNELGKGWEYNMPKVLESSVRIMARYITSREETDKIYRLAAIEVGKTSLWKKTINFLKKQEKENKKKSRYLGYDK